MLFFSDTRIFVVSVRMGSSFSWCLGKAALFTVALPGPSILLLEISLSLTILYMAN